METVTFKTKNVSRQLFEIELALQALYLMIHGLNDLLGLEVKELNSFCHIICSSADMAENLRKSIEPLRQDHDDENDPANDEKDI